MKKPNFDFVGNIKKYIVFSLALFVIGAVCFGIFGLELDITFKGGSRFTYTYEGDLDLEKVQDAADKALGKSTTVTGSDSATEAGSSKIIISIAGTVDAKDVVIPETSSADDEKTATTAGTDTTTDTDTSETSESSEDVGTQNALETALRTDFPDNNIKFAESNVVEASVARGFYAKCIVAVILTAVLIIIYVGIRFRKIGGISAAVFALVALVHDIIIAFITCIVLRLSIDTNFVAVVLTILGYSLNDTIIIYDRIRENRRKNRTADLGETVNLSINQTLGRTLITALTTFISVVIVAIVAEIFGLTTLRSFAIPMSVGMVSGSYSTICLAGPLWVKWQNFSKSRRIKKSERKKAR